MNLNIKGNIYTNQNSTAVASVLQAKQNEASQSSFVNTLIAKEEQHANQRIKPAEHLVKKREYNEEDEQRQQKEHEQPQQKLKRNSREQHEKTATEVVSSHLNILA